MSWWFCGLLGKSRRRNELEPKAASDHELEKEKKKIVLEVATATIELGKELQALAIDQFGGRYHRSELIPSAKESAEMAAEAYMHLAQYAADHDFADEEHRKQVSGYYARAGYYYRMIGKFDAAKSAYQNALNYGRLDTASQITALRGLRDVSTTKKDYVDYALQLVQLLQTPDERIKELKSCHEMQPLNNEVYNKWLRLASQQGRIEEVGNAVRNTVQQKIERDGTKAAMDVVLTSVNAVSGICQHLYDEFNIRQAAMEKKIEEHEKKCQSPFFQCQPTETTPLLTDQSIYPEASAPPLADDGPQTKTFKLAESDPRNQFLKLLHKYFMDDTGFDAAYRNLCLHKLDLSSQEIGDQGLTWLVSLLQNKDCGIWDLNLSGNQITGNGIRLLTDVLCSADNAPPIFMLDLSSNDLGDEGAKHIANCLRTNNQLRKFKVNNCGIGDSGVKCIANALALSNRTVCRIQMRNNIITDQGCKAICDVSNHNLIIHEIDMSNNYIGQDGYVATLMCNNYGIRVGSTKW